MFCTKCGVKINKGEKFCAKCGQSAAKEIKQKTKQAGDQTTTSTGSAASSFKQTLEPLAKLGKKKLIIAGAVIVVILLTSGLLLATLSDGNKEIVKEQTITEQLKADEDSEVTLGTATFFLPADSISTSSTVEVSTVAKTSIPDLPEKNQIVGEVFNISTTAAIQDEKPAYITLSYSPGNLPAGADKTGLYLAHYDGQQWQPVPGATINSENQTIVAAVTDFSLFSILFNPSILFLQADIIEPVDRFADLPLDIKQDLDSQYSQSSIKSGLYWQVSPLSRLASQTLLGANFINKISGGAIAAVEGGQDMVTDWLLEQIALKAAEFVLTETVGEDAATISLALYDTASLGKELYSEGFSAIKSAPMLQVKAVAWVLARQMDYINANVGEGYSKIASLNLWENVTSNAPLEIYVISVLGENKDTGLMDKGIKFYYKKSGSSYSNYSNAVVGTKLLSVEVESTDADEEDDADSTEPTPTKKPASSPAKSTSSASGCQSLNLTEKSAWYYAADKANTCSNFVKSITSSRASIRCPDRVSRWRGHFVKEINTEGKSSLQIKANLGLNVHDKFFIESGGVGVKYDDYVDLMIFSSNPIPELSSECSQTWDNSVKPAICAVQNTDPGVIGHCGVKKYSASRTCDFTVNTSGKSKVWAVLRVADAWPADPEGSLSNLQACY